MNPKEESSLFGMEGCSVHGEEHMKECNMCGTEFCRLCFPRSAVCPDCAEPRDEDDEEEGADFDDISNLNEVLDKDEEAERILSDSEKQEPPEDMAEDEDSDRSRRY